MDYSQHFSTKKTPQSEPIPGKDQVENNAGGYVFAIDDWKRLERFLILGCEGGTYYATEQKLTVENAQCVLRCFDSDPNRALKMILDISVEGRAPKNDPAVFTLALATAHEKAKHRIIPEHLTQICRTGTHLFQYIQALKSIRGMGRLPRTLVGHWYTDKTVEDAVYQAIKYQQRNGWSHRDVLRIAHPKAEGAMASLFGFLVGKIKADDLMAVAGLQRLIASEHLKKAANAKEAARIIRENDLPRECVPTQFLTDPLVWDALLEKMPLHAMVRNLGNMTKCGLLAPLSDATQAVVDRLRDQDRLHKSRLHPFAILVALETYKQGKGLKGSGTWNAQGPIVDALDAAFYLAFKNVTPTGRRWLLALDVSGSMAGAYLNNTTISARTASAAMALVTANAEPRHHIVGFTTNGWTCPGSGLSQFAGMGYRNGLSPLTISPRQRLDDVTGYINGLSMGGTDCALPMLYATEHKIPVDVFSVWTDSETWAGKIHPIQALKDYRQKMGIGAKLIVVGLTSSGFSIADPTDAGSLDLVGFDASAPAVMADFAKN